jgi:hypothetical protein
MSIEPKKSGAKARGVASQSRLTAIQVPAEVQPFIKENIIDISGASNFFKRKARVVTLLKGFVEALPDSRFRLENNFDVFFLNNLPLFLTGHPMKPADALADALFRLGREWAKKDYGNLPIGPLPTDEFLRLQWEEAEAWDAFIKSDACFGQIWWHNLSADDCVKKWSGGFNPGDFEIRVEFDFDATKPPKMSVHVKGKPAAVLMNWWMTLNPNSPPQEHPQIKELREKSVALLDSIVGTLKTDLKLIQPQKGRPREKFGERAAYLLDHEKRSLPSIAGELCQLPLNSTAQARRQCFDRIRKAATNYYRLLGHDYTTVTKDRVRVRLIRLPPNPDAVKSE